MCGLLLFCVWSVCYSVRMLVFYVCSFFSLFFVCGLFIVILYGLLHFVCGLLVLCLLLSILCEYCFRFIPLSPCDLSALLCVERTQQEIPLQGGLSEWRQPDCGEQQALQWWVSDQCVCKTPLYACVLPFYAKTLWPQSLCEEVATAVFGTLDCCWYLCICLCEEVATAIFGTLDCCWYLCICLCEGVATDIFGTLDYCWYLCICLCEEVATDIFGTLDCCWYLCICIYLITGVLFSDVCVFWSRVYCLLRCLHSCHRCSSHADADSAVHAGALLEEICRGNYFFSVECNFRQVLTTFFSHIYSSALLPSHFFSLLSCHLVLRPSPTSPILVIHLCLSSSIFIPSFRPLPPPLSAFFPFWSITHLSPSSSISLPPSSLLSFPPLLPPSLFTPLSLSFHPSFLILPVLTLCPPPPHPFCLTLLHLFSSPPYCPPPPLSASPPSPSHLSLPLPTPPSPPYCPPPLHLHSALTFLSFPSVSSPPHPAVPPPPLPLLPLLSWCEHPLLERRS